MKILIITADSELINATRAGFNQSNHQIEYMKSAKEALDPVKLHSIDLVIADVFPKDMNGPELISSLKTGYPDIKIIAMAGRNSREIEMEIRKQGVLYYMLKPYDFINLKSIIDHMEKKCPKYQPAAHKEAAHLNVS